MGWARLGATYGPLAGGEEQWVCSDWAVGVQRAMGVQRAQWAAGGVLVQGAALGARERAACSLGGLRVVGSAAAAAAVLMAARRRPGEPRARSIAGHGAPSRYARGIAPLHTEHRPLPWSTTQRSTHVGPVTRPSGDRHPSVAATAHPTLLPTPHGPSNAPPMGPSQTPATAIP